MTLDPFAPLPPNRDAERYVYDKRDETQVLEVHDGDTPRVLYFPSCDQPVARWLRLAGINAPELFGATKAAAEASRDHLTSLLAGAENITVQTIKTRTSKERKSLGRYVALMWVTKGGRTFNVAAQMLADGHASLYPS